MRAPVTHSLKIKEMWLDRLLDGSKKCEVRVNDRDYQIGDFLEFCDYRATPPQRHLFQVTHVLPGGQYGIQPGWCVLSVGVVVR